MVYRADAMDSNHGYVYSLGAKAICPLIERGTQFSAEVSRTNNDQPQSPLVYIYVFQLTEPLVARRNIIGADWVSLCEAQVDCVCRRAVDD